MSLTSRIVKWLEDWVPFFEDLTGALDPFLGQYAPLVVTVTILILMTGIIEWFKLRIEQKRIPMDAYLGEQDEWEEPSLVVKRRTGWVFRYLFPGSIKSLSLDADGISITRRNSSKEIQWSEVQSWYCENQKWILWGSDKRIKLSLSEMSGLIEKDRQRINRRLIHHLLDVPRSNWPWQSKLFAAKDLHLRHHVPDGLRRHELRSNDPPPNGNNINEHDLIFYGKTVFEAEQIWNDDDTRGTSCDGEIFDHIAIYREVGRGSSKDDQFIAHEMRYNPLFMVRPHRPDNPTPFFSFAKRLPSIKLAVDWLGSGTLAASGRLPSQLEERLEGLRVE